MAMLGRVTSSSLQHTSPPAFLPGNGVVGPEHTMVPLQLPSCEDAEVQPTHNLVCTFKQARYKAYCYLPEVYTDAIACIEQHSLTCGLRLLIRFLFMHGLVFLLQSTSRQHLFICYEHKNAVPFSCT